MARLSLHDALDAALMEDDAPRNNTPQQAVAESSRADLSAIEGRAVTVSFLERFTAEHATPALKAAATRAAIPLLETQIRTARQELALGAVPFPI